MRKNYFKNEPNAPAPLRITVHQTVRFNEVDMMGIVWHGCYTDYFEVARGTLAKSAGWSFQDYSEQGVLLPIKQLKIDYQKPLHYGDDFSIEAIMHWTEGARINMEFILRDHKGEVATTGFSVQLMVDRKGELLLGVPPCHLRLQERWRTGKLNHLVVDVKTPSFVSAGQKV